MQAIVTKYLPPTNHRGSRIKATCNAGSITVPWDDYLDADDNHEAAIMALAEKLGWHEREWHFGWLPREHGMVGVQVNKHGKG